MPVLLAENLGGETQRGPGALCGERRMGWGSAMRSMRTQEGGYRMRLRYRFLVTPLRRSPSPPSHILRVLAHVSSCSLQFLNPFHSHQRFLAAEVAVRPSGGRQGRGELPRHWGI